MTIAESKITNPNDFTGLSVIVSPKVWDEFHEFQGTIVGINNDLFKVQDKDDDIFFVEEDQIEILD
jgi:hypothetical protein